MKRIAPVQLVGEEYPPAVAFFFYMANGGLTEYLRAVVHCVRQIIHLSSILGAYIAAPNSNRHIAYRLVDGHQPGSFRL